MTPEQKKQFNKENYLRNQANYTKQKREQYHAKKELERLKQSENNTTN